MQHSACRVRMTEHRRDKYLFFQLSSNMDQFEVLSEDQMIDYFFSIFHCYCFKNSCLFLLISACNTVIIQIVWVELQPLLENNDAFSF